MHIRPDRDDAPEFIAEIEALLRGAIQSSLPPAIILIKVDGWFGPRWLEFSGKAIGAVGVWKSNLTVPPFVPNRIVSQRRFSLPGYTEVDRGKSIHRDVPSVEALHRRVSQIADGAALAWYSGNSKADERGALMVYLPGSGGYWPWYAGWARQEAWKIVETKEITRQELAGLMNQVNSGART